jgi:hypothetical protein
LRAGHYAFEIRPCGDLTVTAPDTTQFKRQCYGTLWFEETTLALLTDYENNFMFSTDYPHPTSLSSGPASPATPAHDHITRAYNTLDPSSAKKSSPETRPESTA